MPACGSVLSFHAWEIAADSTSRGVVSSHMKDVLCRAAYNQIQKGIIGTAAMAVVGFCGAVISAVLERGRLQLLLCLAVSTAATVVWRYLKKLELKFTKAPYVHQHHN